MVPHTRRTPAARLGATWPQGEKGGLPTERMRARRSAAHAPGVLCTANAPAARSHSHPAVVEGPAGTQQCGRSPLAEPLRLARGPSPARTISRRSTGGPKPQTIVVQAGRGCRAQGQVGGRASRLVSRPSSSSMQHWRKIWDAFKTESFLHEHLRARACVCACTPSIHPLDAPCVLQALNQMWNRTASANEECGARGQLPPHRSTSLAPSSTAK